MIFLYDVSKVNKLIETEIGIAVSKGREEEKINCGLTTTEFNFYKMERVWRSVIQQGENPEH